MAEPVHLQHWSTSLEAPHRRLDCYADLLSSLLAPMHLTAAPEADFEANVTSVDLTRISVVSQSGSAHGSCQHLRDQAKADSRSYYLILSLAAPWDADQRGRHRLEPGDAMLFDATLPWSISHAGRYDIINIRISDAWLRQWVSTPSILVGRPLRANEGWGRALAGFASQLSPDFFIDSPLPHAVVTDHLGALLALLASQFSGTEAPSPESSRSSLCSRIIDCIEQRGVEAGLTAEMVAMSIGVSVRTLHRCLASEQLCFGTVLVSARARAAVRMLSSPMYRRLTIAEVARRSGFTHASHFSRVLRASTGRTPSEIRQDVGKAIIESSLCQSETHASR